MKLVIIRHADAGDRQEFAKTGKPDDLRPLSDKGRNQMKAAVAGLRTLVPKCDLIATSPLTRARQTAKIVAAEYEGAAQETTETLEPDTAPDDFLHWMGQRDASVAMIVGHEPVLGALATWLMTGAGESRVDFRKAGACLLEFESTPRKGEGVLRWHMGPKELAKLP